MTETHVSIGRIKRDISELVNRVAYGGERIVLTSRGKPKAALVSIEDYERLEREHLLESLVQWQAWLRDAENLANAITNRRNGEPLDVDALWMQAHRDLEMRDAQQRGS